MFRLPDFFILLAACVAFLMAGFLWFHGHKASGQFVATWVLMILGIGIYVKLCLLLDVHRD